MHVQKFRQHDLPMSSDNSVEGVVNLKNQITRINYRHLGKC